MKVPNKGFTKTFHIKVPQKGSEGSVFRFKGSKQRFYIEARFKSFDQFPIFRHKTFESYSKGSQGFWCSKWRFQMMFSFLCSGLLKQRAPFFKRFAGQSVMFFVGGVGLVWF